MLHATMIPFLKFLFTKIFNSIQTAKNIPRKFCTFETNFCQCGCKFSNVSLKINSARDQELYKQSYGHWLCTLICSKCYFIIIHHGLMQQYFFFLIIHMQNITSKIQLGLRKKMRIKYCTFPAMSLGVVVDFVVSVSSSIQQGIKYFA
jgi:hypothetical protein